MKQPLYNKLLKPAICLFLLPGLLVSCTHYYYAPNTNNTPLLKEKNEGKVNGQYYVTDEANGIEVQAAYATGKHTAVMASYTSARHGSKSEHANSDNGYGNYIEAGIGYFTTINKSNWVFETYVGLGTGKITNTYHPSESSKTRFNKVFIQPALGYASKYFEVALSSKLSFVHLAVKNSSATTAYNFSAFRDINYIRENPSSVLWEPGIVLRGGIKNMKLTINYTGSVNLFNNWKQEDYGMSLGLCIPFNINAAKQ